MLRGMLLADLQKVGCENQNRVIFRNNNELTLVTLKSHNSEVESIIRMQLRNLLELIMDFLEHLIVQKSRQVFSKVSTEVNSRQGCLTKTKGISQAWDWGLAYRSS